MTTESVDSSLLVEEEKKSEESLVLLRERRNFFIFHHRGSDSMAIQVCNSNYEFLLCFPFLYGLFYAILDFSFVYVIGFCSDLGRIC